MELIGFRYLLEVVEAGSFAKASTRLGLNPSTLSRVPSRMWLELGVA